MVAPCLGEPDDKKHYFYAHFRHPIGAEFFG